MGSNQNNKVQIRTTEFYLDLAFVFSTNSLGIFSNLRHQSVVYSGGHLHQFDVVEFDADGLLSRSLNLGFRPTSNSTDKSSIAVGTVCSVTEIIFQNNIYIFQYFFLPLLAPERESKGTEKERKTTHRERNPGRGI